MAILSFLRISCNKTLILQSSIRKSSFLHCGNQRVIKSCYNYNLISARVSDRRIKLDAIELLLSPVSGSSAECNTCILLLFISDIVFHLRDRHNHRVQRREENKFGCVTVDKRVLEKNGSNETTSQQETLANLRPTIAIGSP